MAPYIENLTDELIENNRYDKVAQQLRGDWETFLMFVKFNLETNDLKNMTSEALGKVIGFFEVGNILAYKSDLFREIRFAGDCKETLRELAAYCLAYVITHRLDPLSLIKISPYRTVRRATAVEHADALYLKKVAR